MIMTSGQQYAIAAASPDKMFLDGVCSDTVGLYVDTPPMPPMAEENVIEYDVPGLSGKLNRKTGTYQDITITVRCFVFDGGYHPGQIYKFLSNAKTLSFTRATGYFYQVKKVLGVTPQYQTSGKNFLNVQFVCSPFRYRKQNIPQAFSASPANVYNMGNIYSEPVYRLTIKSDAQLAIFRVNGIALQILANALDTGTIVIDIPRKKIYKESSGDVLTIVQQYTSGAFWNMTLNHGANELTWNSEITSVEVTANERWL